MEDGKEILDEVLDTLNSVHDDLQQFVNDENINEIDDAIYTIETSIRRIQVFKDKL
jgi:hypothetical protein